LNYQKRNKIQSPWRWRQPFLWNTGTNTMHY